MIRLPLPAVSGRWRPPFTLLLFVVTLVCGSVMAFGQSFLNKSVDLAALPKVPDKFTVTLFASEPLVRQPCSMAFEERGRLFVGMGPQYRNPTPETPGDRVVIVQDTDADGWLLVWSAEFQADRRAIVFGDQEEMGFGARVATPFTEKNGGTLRSSTGKKTAKDTWGQPAAWCDYSGTNGDHFGGIMLMASSGNFRASWWHNRDYGVFVANPFGREAMQQGARSSVPVAKGEALRLTFGALVHDHREFDAAAEFTRFERILATDSTTPLHR